jgi:hypothetical protein
MAVEKSAEVMIGIQNIRQDLTKLKDVIDTIAEEADEDPEAEEGDNRDEDEDQARSLQRRRRQMKFTKRLAPIIRRLSEDTMHEFFRSQSHQEILRELNTNADHRNKVIDWLDVMLTMQVSEEMNKKQAC